MECKTFLYLDQNGEKVFKSKKSFNTLDEAIEVCKVLNLQSKQIKK